MSYLNFLVQLTEKDKRLLVALFIVLIIIFVLIAYIGQGIKALMKRYSKGIDGYMHDLCSNKLVTNPKDFRKQVFKKETKVLYSNTRWFMRVFIVITAGFVIYSLIARPGGENTPFAYFSETLSALFIKLDWPKGEFFGINNFPVDWPHVAKGVEFRFTLPSIVTYIVFICWIVTLVGVFTSTLKFIARINRGIRKSTEVFTRNLDDANFIEE